MGRGRGRGRAVHERFEMIMVRARVLLPCKADPDLDHHLRPPPEPSISSIHPRPDPNPTPTPWQVLLLLVQALWLHQLRPPSAYPAPTPGLRPPFCAGLLCARRASSRPGHFGQVHARQVESSRVKSRGACIAWGAACQQALQGSARGAATGASQE